MKSFGNTYMPKRFLANEVLIDKNDIYLQIKT